MIHPRTHKSKSKDEFPQFVSWIFFFLVTGRSTSREADVHAQSLSCVWLFETPMDYSPSGSSVHGISQARTLQSIAISSSRGSSRPRDGTPISYIRRRILYHWATWKAQRGRELPPNETPHPWSMQTPALLTGVCSACSGYQPLLSWKVCGILSPSAK